LGLSKARDRRKLTNDRGKKKKSAWQCLKERGIGRKKSSVACSDKVRGKRKEKGFFKKKRNLKRRKGVFLYRRPDPTQGKSH